MKPRILFIGAFPPPGSDIRGGIATSCRMLLGSSFADAFDLDLIDSTQRSIPEPPVLQRALYAAARVLRFVTRLERHRPAAVVAFSSQGASFIEKSACAVYARARGIPVVLLMRGGPFMDDCRRSRSYRWLARQLLRAPAAIGCQGESWRRFFRDELGIDERRLPVVHNWTARPEYLALPRALPAPGAPLRVLFMGWLDRAKGIFELLAAARMLHAMPGMPDFTLHFAGGGAHADALRTEAGADIRSGEVVMHGWVGGEEKTALLRAADVFVLPSYGEGMPNSMIEAMATGLPVVVTPVGGIPDVIVDGENGILVPPRDAARLRAALAGLLDSPERRAALGAAARETARERFGVERGARDLAGVVNAVIAGRPASAAVARPPAAELPPPIAGARLHG